MPDEIGIAEQYAGCVLVGAKDGYWFSGLHEERFVRGKFLERANDGMETFPVSRRFSGAAIDDQVVRFFSDLWIEIVHQHAKSGFLLPAFAGDLGSAGRFERTLVRRREKGGVGGNRSHKRSRPILSQGECICTKAPWGLKCTLLFIEARPEAAIAPRK